MHHSEHLARIILSYVIFVWWWSAGFSNQSALPIALQGNNKLTLTKKKKKKQARWAVIDYTVKKQKKHKTVQHTLKTADSNLKYMWIVVMGEHLKKKLLQNSPFKVCF